MQKILRTAAKMTSNLTIQSTIKLNSGYEIPRLGFGVSSPTPSASQLQCM